MFLDQISLFKRNSKFQPQLASIDITKPLIDTTKLINYSDPISTQEIYQLMLNTKLPNNCSLPFLLQFMLVNTITELLNYYQDLNYIVNKLILEFGVYHSRILLGKQLFNESNTVETMADIIRLLGTPTLEEIKNLKSQILNLKMPETPKFSMSKRFQEIQNDQLVDLLEKIFVYDPNQSISAFEILLHPFFQEIKQPNIKINSKSLPNLFNFTKGIVSIQSLFGKQYKTIIIIIINLSLNYRGAIIE
ncbi:unnamed protein product (macronuclear) [Paramecium tetraurelia]|uniref:Protein kinase domain-containing protein n=1 Tax=Paramecium tetraurelia TaxID=5888 RepID=A0ED55_PARTE|nr:uncharacterized protein GSPATT00004091001 [Paramecium tetraurelia]CAK93222.1 unnamed protein product [Paramecium tetraurelia]|eukprot:XP_001460619.1 hypothetical protein (macronuclear) [Paramecium tetraurelia strain d4-2]